MTPAEHHAEAERLLGEYAQATAESLRYNVEYERKLELARVHALLALAAEDFRP